MFGVGFFGAIVIGLIAGFVAEKVTKSDHGLFKNLIVGLIGAVVGNFIATRVPIFNFGSGFLDQLVIATLGAIGVLFVYQKLRQS